MKEKTNIPRCIGIIMDGNRRWARARGLPTVEGHKAGYRKLHELALWAKEAGIEYVILYAMSTENWHRKKEEVDAVMDIFRTALRDEIDVMSKEKIRIRFVGQVERFSDDIRELMQQAEKETEANEACTFVLAVSYGGRPEILHAINRIVAEGNRGEITEEGFAYYLWTKGIPDPDLIIRTGGEKRLSNFLPWQSVYSELFFTETHWPDFSKEEFEKILQEFARRERRHGR